MRALCDLRLGLPRQQLDGVGEVLIGDVVGALGDANIVRLAQHVGVGGALRRLELVAGKLQQLAQRIAEVDRVHEAAVDLAGVAEAQLLEPRLGLRVGGARHREGQMMQVADAHRVGPGIGLGRLSGEDGDQPAVAGVEVEMVGLGIVEVGLLEHQRHAEHALPEVDRRLPVGANQRDVMHALGLEFGHVDLRKRGSDPSPQRCEHSDTPDTRGLTPAIIKTGPWDRTSVCASP